MAMQPSGAVQNRPAARQLVDDALSRVALDPHDVAGVRPGLEALADSLVRETGLTSDGFRRARDGIDVFCGAEQ